ncbi:conjugal transfer protein [Bordetella ansorpii]|uniref:Conjugal transfer protein n=1 Tax=Bordetella ansorpii TaxID=288768 RepID=A0A157QLQ6_9BORD|nr:MobF family relaxase [Bordetella ansorpii]SAI46651.1 conjugal transfer protein [Bordetella ansorpii]
MISRKVLHRSAAAKTTHYYAEQQDDYYSRDGDASRWLGRGAAALGLSGTVDLEQFRAALRGDFGEGVALAKSIRSDARARAGLDLTFSAPKSVTIQALIGKDPAVVAAHDRAVEAALAHMERHYAYARQRVDGRVHIESTGNIVVAAWRHETARPTKGSPPDPQLHTHAIVMNLTQRADGKWAAMSNEEIFRTRKLLDAIYTNELARQLQLSGYSIRLEGRHIELAHISRQQIEVFSKRTAQINAELQHRHLTRETASHGTKQAITLATRQAKAANLPRAVLQATWEQQAREAGLALTRPPRAHGRDLEQEASSGLPANSGHGIAEHAVNWAIRHLTEREANMSASALLSTALEHVAGRTDAHTIETEIRRQTNVGRLILGTQLYREASQEFGTVRDKAAWNQTLIRSGLTPKEAAASVRALIAHGQLVAVEPHFTTEAARTREKRILQIEREGRGQVTPIIDATRLATQLAGLSLKPGQRAASEMILGSAHRIVGVQGLAGTGKSYMLAQVKALAQANGYKLHALASYGGQVRALRELGIEANTVASMLEARNAARLELDERTILVVDEAGVVPSRLMEKLLQRVESAGARTVLLGDTEQTKAVEAGRPFHQLQDAGMATARMSDIVRQHDPTLRRAVELAAEGKASASLGVLQSVHEIADDGKRYGRIAAHYVQVGGDTLILTGTNDSRNRINQAVHEASGLDGKGHEHNLLTRRDTTQAQRRYARYYVDGDVIQPERSYASGLQAGQAYRIMARDTMRNTLTVENLSTAERISFNPLRATKLSVYQPVRAELSVGSWVRVTRNDAARDLVNGGRFEVVAVSRDTITIRNNARTVTLPADHPVHLDRAYATTVHSAQGLTADRVLINAESYSRTTKSDVYYVGISRARHSADIYTDSKSKLPAAADRREDKTAALDIGLRRPSEPSLQKHTSLEAGVSG